MKNLCCNRLAACLCMKQSPFPSAKRSLRKILPVDVVSRHNDRSDQCDHFTTETAENESMKKLLKEIRDLLKSRDHKEQEQRYEDDKENEMKNDWMLAAAVLDRICAIASIVTFVGGTLVFFIVFAIHP